MKKLNLLHLQHCQNFSTELHPGKSQIHMTFTMYNYYFIIKSYTHKMIQKTLSGEQRFRSLQMSISIVNAKP